MTTAEWIITVLGRNAAAAWIAGFLMVSVTKHWHARKVLMTGCDDHCKVDHHGVGSELVTAGGIAGLGILTSVDCWAQCDDHRWVDHHGAGGKCCCLNCWVLVGWYYMVLVCSPTQLR